MAELENATKPKLDKYCNWCCGKCGKMLFNRDEKCPWCGKAVKWDEPPICPNCGDKMDLEVPDATSN